MVTAADNVVPLTGDPLIDGLTWGAAWQFGTGPHVLTYSLSLNDNPNGGTWNTGLADGVRAALAAWSNVANLSFVEVGSGTVYTQSSADLAFILTGNELQTNSGIGVVGLGLPPSTAFADSLLSGSGETRSSYPQPEGDIAIDNYYTGFSYLGPGGVGLTILLHEVGHALGLKHTDSAYDGRPSFASLGITAYDSNLYTVMSYKDPNGAQIGINLSSGNAATPMPLDILAIQQIYGANTGFHTGNDTYFLDSNAVVQTIWDSGGQDTLSAVSMSAAVTIDLRPGMYSYVSGWQGRTGLAYSTSIENAIGGMGNDTLVGNDVANILDGGNGADSMSGGGGNDEYIVDAGGDVVLEISGGGYDTVHSTVSYSMSPEVEAATFNGSAMIVGRGNDSNNLLTGNAGVSTLIAGSGDDIIFSGVGITAMHGGFGDDDYHLSSSPVMSGARWSIAGRPGEYISQGQTASFQIDQNQTIVLLHDLTHDGIIDNLTLFGWDISGTHNFSFSATTDQLGENLLPGDYLDARRANVGIAGHAGLDFGMDGRGASQNFSTFVINDIQIDYSGTSPRLIRLVASFEQHSELPTAPLLTGMVAYGTDVQMTSIISERPGQGVDEVFSQISYSLPANVEHLHLEGTANLMGVGNELGNQLEGNTGDNEINGGFGNDTLTGGAGDDSLNGGFGLDIAIFAGARSGYSIIRSGNVYTVTDTNLANGNDGTDTLVGVERLQFADAELGISTAPGMRIGQVEYPANWLDYYTIADFNSDGKTDIWWKTKAGMTGVWTTETASSWNPDAMRSPFADWTTTDGNGDGRADAAYQHLAAGGSQQWVNAEQSISLGNVGTDHGWGMF